MTRLIVQFDIFQMDDYLWKLKSKYETPSTKYEKGAHYIIQKTLNAFNQEFNKAKKLKDVLAFNDEKFGSQLNDLIAEYHNPQTDYEKGAYDILVKVINRFNALSYVIDGDDEEENIYLT